MKVFHCDHCDHLVFFENTQCVACGHTLAFLPDVMEIASLEPAGDAFRSPAPAAAGRAYRLCGNYVEQAVCNWAVPAGSDQPLCESCQLTRRIPDLTQPGTLDAWRRLELAKRRVVYTLKNLGLPMMPQAGPDEAGLAFHFLADDPSTSGPVLTGHSSGTITVNIAEADDAERERRRCALGEPYRTLLGHLRHETGHYYWDHLIANRGRLDAFRQTFGDERVDYGAALQQHYQMGPRPGWQDYFVSTYAAVHPWEDWAETWMHYLHMVDTMETAAACGVSIRPGRSGEPSLAGIPDTSANSPFHRLIAAWFPITYVLNNLNRGMGLADAYPFVLSPVVVDKLRFVHDAVVAAAEAGRVG